MKYKKYSISFYSLSSVGTGKLIDIVEAIADDMFDGHYTIFRFTTGYKGCWGTPNLYDGCAVEIDHWRTHRTLDTLLIHMITTALKLDKK